MSVTRAIFKRLQTALAPRSRLHSELNERINYRPFRQYKNFGHARREESYIVIGWRTFVVMTLCLGPIAMGRLDIYEEGDDKDKPEEEKVFQYNEATHSYNSPY